MRKALLLLIGLPFTIVPAGARITGEDALKLCRDQIRQGALARFGSTDIVFRTTTLSESEGADDLVSGSFLSRGNGNSGAHRFACSVDAENSSLRSARIDSRNAAASAAATPDTGYADGELTDICRSAVRDKIYNHGYIRAKFNTVSAEKSQGANYLVNGKATGETGGHESVFLFSCRVNRLTGAADSVELKAH